MPLLAVLNWMRTGIRSLFLGRVPWHDGEPIAEQVTLPARSIAGMCIRAGPALRDLCCRADFYIRRNRTAHTYMYILRFEHSTDSGISGWPMCGSNGWIGTPGFM